MSSCGRSNGRGGHNGEPSLEEVLKRLHALEQHVFMNREPTEVFVEQVNNEDLWNNISFEESAVFQTNLGQPVSYTLHFLYNLLTYLKFLFIFYS